MATENVNFFVNFKMNNKNVQEILKLSQSHVLRSCTKTWDTRARKIHDL